MSEERKPTALSSGSAPGKIQQDDPSTMAIAGDLNNFFVRRQLLTMESKRIQDLLLEAEDELKAKQDNRDLLRDKVFAAFRDPVETPKNDLAETPKKKPKLKYLPKTTERYIRRRAKQLFAGLRTGSAGITGDPDAVVRAEDAGWLLPKARHMDAWAGWFAESDRTSSKASRFRKDRIQIAFVASGGIGDLLKSTHLVGPLARYFSGDVTILGAQTAVGEVLASNPYVIDTLVPATQHVFGFADRLQHIPLFDLIVIWKYSVQYVIPRGSRIAPDDIRSIESGSSDLRRILDKYLFLWGWPSFNFAFSRDMARLGLSVMNVSSATSGLPHRHLDEIPFFPTNQSLRGIAGLLIKPYVTVHHGFDLKFLPIKTRETDYKSTKNISLEQWRQIVSLLRKEGVEVIQLGIVEEEKIEGVTRYLNGQLSLEEAGLLIKHGLCHIDTEGGLVHLAHAVHTRCVVLFGPTPTEFFGYPQNINLEPTGCKACWFVTKTWLIECPRHTSGPECMSGHSPSAVADAAKRIIAEAEKPSAKLITAETQPSTTPWADMIAMAQGHYSPDASGRVLLILDHPPSDFGSWSDSLPVADVIICAGKHFDLETHDRIIKKFEYGSLLNLQRPSSSVDAVVWVSRELESDIVPLALREILRVLKPGGQLVFAAIGETAGLDLGRSLSAARIAFDESKMPSRPVFSCSLLKNGPPPDSVPLSSRPAVSELGAQTAQARVDAVDPRLALLEEENSRQISLVRDRFAQRKEVMDDEWSVVDGPVQRVFGSDGWIRIAKSSAEVYAIKFFIKGWHTPTDSVIWSRDEKCLLMLPLPEEQSLGDHRVELQLHVAVPEASEANPASIGLRVDDGPVENFILSSSGAILKVRSANASKFRGVSLVEIRFGAGTGRKEGDESSASLRTGVLKFRYRVLPN
jgi:Glycosyltransferase family 9 (heptosyltransferase)